MQRIMKRSAWPSSWEKGRKRQTWPKGETVNLSFGNYVKIVLFKLREGKRHVPLLQLSRLQSRTHAARAQLTGNKGVCLGCYALVGTLWTLTATRAPWEANFTGAQLERLGPLLKVVLSAHYLSQDWVPQAGEGTPPPRPAAKNDLYPSLTF